MNHESSTGPDERLRTRFRALRAVRTAQAGTFGASVTRARQRPRAAPSRHHWKLALAMGAVIILLNAMIASTRVQARLQEDITLARQVDALVTWRSPTHTLLTQHQVWSFTLSASTIVPPISSGGLQ